MAREPGKVDAVRSGDDEGTSPQMPEQPSDLSAGRGLADRPEGSEPAASGPGDLVAGGEPGGRGEAGAADTAPPIAPPPVPPGIPPATGQRVSALVTMSRPKLAKGPAREGWNVSKWPEAGLPAEVAQGGTHRAANVPGVALVAAVTGVQPGRSRALRVRLVR